MNTKLGTQDAVIITLSNVNKGTEEITEYSKGSVRITQRKSEAKK